MDQLVGEKVYLCTSNGLVAFTITWASSTPLDGGNTLVTVVLDSSGGMHADLVNPQGQYFSLSGGSLVWNFALPADAGSVSMVRGDPPTCAAGG